MEEELEMRSSPWMTVGLEEGGIPVVEDTVKENGTWEEGSGVVEDDVGR